MLGTLMFASKIAMDALPNIHLLGMFTLLYTVVFRKKALIPIYVFVFLCGIYGGFDLWWIPYLYMWALLWALTMLLPKNMKPKIAMIVYPAVCGLFGLAFGTLYAPAYALMFHLDFRGMIAWIAAGVPFDALHAAGNLCAGLLIFPLSKVLGKLQIRYM
ncbi:MAG: hypothetical protein J5922_02995 [Clostridia bacterium]|nr:hypothetical protein [Clostridia bacterium]